MMGLVSCTKKCSFIQKVVRSHQSLSRVTVLDDQISDRCWWMVTYNIYSVFHPQGNPVTNRNEDFPLGKKSPFLGPWQRTENEMVSSLPILTSTSPLPKTGKWENVEKGRGKRGEWHLLNIRSRPAYHVLHVHYD